MKWMAKQITTLPKELVGRCGGAHSVGDGGAGDARVLWNSLPSLHLRLHRIDAVGCPGLLPVSCVFYLFHFLEYLHLKVQ